MGLSELYQRMALISPYIEVFLRHLYWRNVERLKRYNPNKATNSRSISVDERVDFEDIVEWLKAKGVGEGDLLIIHSGYGELERTGLSPNEIVERLLRLVGPTGTLAMPVIRRYKDIEKAQKKGVQWSEIKGKYNVKKTLVVSGLLPYTLMQHEDAVISHHPYNPLCAVGPLAKAMMEHNLDGEAPSPHGPNSCWRFCYDHGVKVCSIGTDIEHHNTIGHIVEESFGNWYWPDEVWYDYVSFEIIDEQNNSREVIVKNRKSEWGKLHLAELNSISALKKAGGMESSVVDGIRVGFVDPQIMVGFYQSRNKKGFPYFLYPWEDAHNVK